MMTLPPDRWPFDTGVLESSPHINAIMDDPAMEPFMQSQVVMRTKPKNEPPIKKEFC